MLYRLLRTVLFQLDPEQAHDVVLKNLKRIHTFLPSKHYDKPREVMGIQFPNPIGLAAGLDKDGDYIDALAALGFGFIEIGTVVPKPQTGNDKPRLFRLVNEQALINRMGFNSKGLDYCIENLKKKKFTGVLGINIGRNKATPNERAIDDYLACMRGVYPYASYITINISSPNTPDLRQLQNENYLSEFLTTLKVEQQDLARKHKKYVPLVVKIAPDLTDDEITKMAEIFLNLNIEGVIATNTTIDRDKIKHHALHHEAGGLSGRPVFEKSTKVLEKLHHQLQGRIPIIAAGGISSAQDAKQKFAKGAQLIQLYTGLIYQGPGLIKEIFNSL